MVGIFHSLQAKIIFNDVGLQILSLAHSNKQTNKQTNVGKINLSREVQPCVGLVSPESEQLRSSTPNTYYAT